MRFITLSFVDVNLPRFVQRLDDSARLTAVISQCSWFFGSLFTSHEINSVLGHSDRGRSSESLHLGLLVEIGAGIRLGPWSEFVVGD